MLCLGGVGASWGYEPVCGTNRVPGEPGIYLYGDRCTNPQSKNNIIPSPTEDLIMVIGQANGTGQLVNVTKCPELFLNPMIDAGYNGVMLDIESKIYFRGGNPKQPASHRV